MTFCCSNCSTEYRTVGPKCDKCGGFVVYAEDNTERLRDAVDSDPTAALPQYETAVTMGEGDTPMTPLKSWAADVDVYGKLESLNPTCSFKDRGSALAVSAVADPDTSWEAVVVASTGNTAPSVAAYAARAGVPCAVLVPETTASSKLSQVAAHDADVFTVDGVFSDCFQLSRQVQGREILNGTAVYSANPFVASGNRTVAFEIVSILGEVPDWVTVPVGAGPLLGGTYQGFVELENAGITSSRPKMACVQSRGCHPIVRAHEEGEQVREWEDEITTDVNAIADPLRGYPEDGQWTLDAVHDSDGIAIAVSDEDTFETRDRLSETEGIYIEPASATSVAAISEIPVEDGDTVVPLLTGHGIKEPAEGEPETTNLDRGPDQLRKALLG